MSIRIILAENHTIVREGLRSLIAEQPGMEVVAEAEDGQAAVELVQELVPDVVIMDVNMPGTNGITATHQVMAGYPDVKVIALSVYGDKRFVMSMLDAGAAGYVLKDSAFEELARAIKAVVAGNTYLSPEVTGIVIEAYRHRWVEPDLVDKPILSRRELQVVELIVAGKTTREIATALEVTSKTIESHRRHVMTKLGVNSIAGITVWAIQEGLLTIEDSDRT
jgi:two-component system response regulator NreC